MAFTRSQGFRLLAVASAATALGVGIFLFDRSDGQTDAPNPTTTSKAPVGSTSSTTAAPSSTFACGPISEASIAFTRLVEALPSVESPTESQMVKVFEAYLKSLDAMGTEVAKVNAALASEWTALTRSAFEGAIAAARAGESYAEATESIRSLNTDRFLVIRSSVEGIVTAQCSDSGLPAQDFPSE